MTLPGVTPSATPTGAPSTAAVGHPDAVLDLGSEVGLGPRPETEPKTGRDPEQDPGPVASLHLDMSPARAIERARGAVRELASTSPSDHARRAALLATLAVAQSLTDPEAAARSLHEAQSALEPARQSHDSDPLPSDVACAQAHLLLGQFALDLSPDALPDRRALASEAVALLTHTEGATAWPGLIPTAYFAYLSSMTESGDARGLDQALSPQAHMSDQFTDMLDHRFAIWFRCSRATMDGRLTLAERLADEAYALAVAAQDVDAETVWAGQTAVIRWMQGRISEMEPVFLHARQADPGEPVWAAAVAWIWVHQGRKRAARGLLASLPSLETFPRGRNFLAAAALLAEVVASVGADEENDRIRRALMPYADRVVTMGLGITSWGTVARPLALLARARGDLDDARHWYEASIELCSVIGAQPWLARAQVELAQIAADQGERARAADLAGESAAAARSLGLRYIEQQADRVLKYLAPPSDDAPTTLPLAGRIGHVEPYPDRTDHSPSPNDLSVPGWARSRVSGRQPHTESTPLSEHHPGISVLGDFQVRYPDGTTAGWKSRKAAMLLKVLVARRGALLARETAMDLLWPDEDPHRLRNRLSVALTAVRRSLDPERTFPANYFVAATSGALRLNLAHVSVDVEEFFALADRARAATASGDAESETLLRQAVDAYTGDALADEPYAAWAEQLREQAHLAYFAASHALAERLAAHGDHLERADLYRGIITLDPYDLAAHDGLIDALRELGASGRLSSARAERHRRMAELGLSAG